jgi:hypothetical protein
MELCEIVLEQINNLTNHRRCSRVMLLDVVDVIVKHVGELLEIGKHFQDGGIRGDALRMELDGKRLLACNNILDLRDERGNFVWLMEMQVTTRSVSDLVQLAKDGRTYRTAAGTGLT